MSREQEWPVHDRFPRVAGECPMGCGSTLFVGSGGHVTCSLLGCPNPTAADDLLHNPPARDFRDGLAVLLDAFADVPEAVRVLKIGEEFGEASQAFIGLHAYNPRKGLTHSRDEVADELADVIVTALVAMGAFTVDPIQRLGNRMRAVVDRHNAAMEAWHG